MIDEFLKIFNRRIAQSGSASGLGPEGRRFESYYPDQFDIYSLGIRGVE